MTTTNAEKCRVIAEKVMGMQLNADKDINIAEAVFQGLLSSRPACEGDPGFGVNDAWVADVLWSGKEYCVPFEGFFGVHVPGNLGHALRWWSVREGKPYQADIEAHVARWRAQPPDYFTDPSAMVELMASDKFVKHFVCLSTWHETIKPTTYCVEMDWHKENDQKPHGPTPMHAVAEAAYQWAVKASNGQKKR